MIEEWLEGDKTAPAKQRHTAARIYERLTEEFSFTGGESTVRHYMRKLRATQSECFLKLEANPGEQMQIDFGHAEVDLYGERANGPLFFLNYPSSYTFPKLSENCPVTDQAGLRYNDI